MMYVTYYNNFDAIFFIIIFIIVVVDVVVVAPREHTVLEAHIHAVCTAIDE